MKINYLACAALLTFIVSDAMAIEGSAEEIAAANQRRLDALDSKYERAIEDLKGRNVPAELSETKALMQRTQLACLDDKSAPICSAFLDAAGEKMGNYIDYTSKGKVVSPEAMKKTNDLIAAAAAVTVPQADERKRAGAFAGTEEQRAAEVKALDERAGRAVEKMTSPVQAPPPVAKKSSPQFEVLVGLKKESDARREKINEQRIQRGEVPLKPRARGIVVTGRGAPGKAN